MDDESGESMEPMDLHMAQLMPLPLIVSCFRKIQIGFTFLVPPHPGSPGKRAIKRVCVCVMLQKISNNITTKLMKLDSHRQKELIKCSNNSSN